jgi:MtN3 and saliva related transmembrane protein
MIAGDSLSLDVIGYLAGALTTIAFVPQVLHILRKRSAQDISLGMFSLFGIGVALWLWYGIRLASVPLIVANGITLSLVLTILILKLHYGSRARSSPTRGKRDA